MRIPKWCQVVFWDFMYLLKWYTIPVIQGSIWLSKNIFYCFSGSEFLSSIFIGATFPTFYFLKLVSLRVCYLKLDIHLHWIRNLCLYFINVSENIQWNFQYKGRCALRLDDHSCARRRYLRTTNSYTQILRGASVKSLLPDVCCLSNL